MTTRIRAVMIAILLALFATPAAAQNCSGQPNANWVCAGPVSGGPGLPGFRAIQAADMVAFAPSVPRLWQPFATNCDSGHSLWWIDQNFCAAWSQSFVTNDDPSVLVTIPVAGTAGPGGASNTLTFTFGSGACVAGCNATYAYQSFSITAQITGTNLVVTSLPGGATIQIGQVITGAGVTAGTVVTGPVPGQGTWVGGVGTYTVNNSQTVASETMTATDALKSIAWGLANAIKANANLYNPTATTTAQQRQIILATANTAAPQVSLDIDGRTSLKITTSVSGASTATSTPPVACGTACTLTWDVGTSLTYSRNPGFVPAAGSNVFQTFFGAPASSGSNVYGQISVTVEDPAISLGSIFLSGQWSSGITSGIYVRRGLYSVSQSDMGADTADFSAYYTNGNNGLAITQAGGASTAVNIFNHASAALVLGTANTGRLTILSGGSTYVSLNSGGIALDAATVFGVAQADGTASEVELQAFGAATFFTGKRNNGTNAAPTTLAVNNVIAALSAEGYDGTAFTTSAAAIQLLAGGTWSNTSHASKMDFYVTPAASTTLTLALEINPDGGTTLGNPTGGDKGAYTFNSQGLIYVNGSTVGASATAPVALSATTGVISINAPWNVTTLTSNGVLYGNSTGTVQVTAQGTNRSVLVGNGVPTFSATPSVTQIVLDNGTGGNAGLALRGPGGSIDGQLVEGGGGNMFFVAPNDSTAGCFPTCNASITDHALNIIAAGVNGSASPTVANDIFHVFTTTDATSSTAAGSIFDGGIAVAKAVNAAGNVAILTGTAIPAGGTASKGYLFSSTSNFGVFFGSGAPTLSAAKGSLYLRSDGSSTSTRAYINTDGGTTWTNITTGA